MTHKFIPSFLSLLFLLGIETLAQKPQFISAYSSECQSIDVFNHKSNELISSNRRVDGDTTIYEIVQITNCAWNDVNAEIKSDSTILIYGFKASPKDSNGEYEIETDMCNCAYKFTYYFVNLNPLNSVFFRFTDGHSHFDSLIEFKQ